MIIKRIEYHKSMLVITKDNIIHYNIVCEILSIYCNENDFVHTLINSLLPDGLLG